MAGPGSPFADPWTSIKSIYSTLLLIFCIVIVMDLIFTQKTTLSKDVHPIFAFCTFWVCVAWMTMVEGGQAALVGLPPVDRSFYRESHTVTFQCTSLAHRGDNLDRYLIGRQFMVLALVFVTNLSGAPLEDTTIFGFPKIMTDIFLHSGLAMILTMSMIGQLNTQVNAAHCMLDYVNTYFALFTLYVALAIEASGLLHCVYLIQYFVSAISGRPIETREEPRNAPQQILFWGRVIVSLMILVIAFAVTLDALFTDRTTAWEGVPKFVDCILFFLFMCVIGMLEGMQIAFFAVTKLPKAQVTQNPIAKRTVELLFSRKGEGSNLQGFMIGRQLCVTLCFFVIARVTTIDLKESDENIFGVPDSVQEFFNTGLLGAIITTEVASITWQLVASAFPVAFLSNPLCYILLRVCLLLEATGICSGTWVIAAIWKYIAGFKEDEEYIGTPEEFAARMREAHEKEMARRRAAGEMDDDDDYDDDEEEDDEES